MQADRDHNRRVAPRISDTDWLVLKDLSAALQREVATQLTPGTRLVDFGCGAMPYRAMIEAQGIEYIGADLDDSADLRIGADGRMPLADGSVDAVLSVQVLEHVRDLDGYCAEIRRVIAPGGTVLLSTHGNWLYHPHPEDHRRWTRTGLEEDLRQRGLAVQAMHPITGPLATTTLIRLTSYAYVLRKIPLIGKPLAGLLAVVMNLRAIAEDRITPAQVRRDNSCVYLARLTRMPG